MPEDHLTKIEGVPSSASIIPGMAYWPGSGPAGTTCGKCVYRGYSQQSRKEFFDINTGETYHKSYRVTKCAMFRKMSGGKNGAAVKKDQASCKYFEKKGRQMNMAGHNSDQDTKALGERINRLMDTLEEAKEDLAQVYKDAKSDGHDVKALRTAIARQREDAEKKKKRIELEEMVETYTAALGGLAETPLGKAAIDKLMPAV